MGEKESAPAPSVTYRRAAEEDVPRMQCLEQICFPPGVAFSVQEFAHHLRQRGSLAILAEQGERLVGLVLVSSHRGGVGHIVTLDVHPDLRRQGIGRTLLRMAEEDLIRQGAREILLQVGVDNEAGLQLYRAQGYRVRSKLRNYYGWGEDAFLMDKMVGKMGERGGMI